MRPRAVGRNVRISVDGLDPVMCEAFPGKMPGSGDRLKDMTNPETARLWADALAVKLRAPA